MDDSLGNIKIIKDHFRASAPSIDSLQDIASSSVSQPRTDNYLRSHSRLWNRRKLRSAAYMLKWNFFSLRGLPWGSSIDGEEKVVLTAVELESLRSDLANLEEKEAHLKAQLEQVDEILRSARLSGYLDIRTRWKPLPGEPPPLDDTDVDDWLPRFVVLQGPCIFFYLFSTVFEGARSRTNILIRTFMEVSLQAQSPLSWRTVFQERGSNLKLKPFTGFSPHGRYSSWFKGDLASGVSYQITASSADFSRRTQRKVTTPTSSPGPKGLVSKTPVGTSGQKTNQTSNGDKKGSSTSSELAGPNKKTVELRVDTKGEWAVEPSQQNDVEEKRIGETSSKDEGSSSISKPSDIARGIQGIENGSVGKVLEELAELQPKGTASKGDDENVAEAILSDKQSLDKRKMDDSVDDKGTDTDKKLTNEASLKSKLEMEEKLRKEEIVRLAEENFLRGNKIFVYPQVVKPDQGIDIFLNRSLSTLRNEPEILIMGAFNDWRWKSFTFRLNKTQLKGDWWSCQFHVPKESHEIDFVFFNGQNVYDNNDEKDFCIAVEGGMDLFAFEDFLLDEKRKELEKLAKEQAERERQVEEQRRIEAEKAASEADRTEARAEIERRRKMVQELIKKAVRSVENVWYIEPSEFKGEDLVKLYYNRSAGPLAHAKELWIHGGHNNWKDGLSIVERLVSSEKKDGDWSYANVIVPDQAVVLDWVFADGPPQSAVLYDNNHRHDFHAIVPKSIPEELSWVEEEHQIYRKLQDERRLREEAIRAKAERTARMKAEMKERTLKRFLLSQKHIVYTEPIAVQAGSMATVFYNPANTVLNGKPEVWFRGSFNRWTHRKGPLPPQKMLPAETGSHVKTTVRVPLDAYMMDFVFSEKEDDDGLFDNKKGMDYHIPVFGGVLKESPMHIVHISVEMAPIAKVGGLGDVVTSLSRAVQDLNHHVDIILPKYDCLNLSNVKEFQYNRSYSWGGTEIKVWFGKVEDVPVYFLEPQNGFFYTGCMYGCKNDAERFGFFCHAALEFLLRSGFHPDIIHCHDWSTAPVAWLYKNHYMHYGLSKARVVFTIHNLEFGAHFIGKAVGYSDKATTVSDTYAKEVAGNPAIAPHLYKFHCIINGIDQDIWDPYNDKFIPISYTSENVVEGKQAAKEALQQRLGLKTADLPVVGIITRLTHQKGIHLIKHAIWHTLERNGQVVLLGSAPDPRIQNDFVNLANQLHSSYGDRVCLCLTYDEPLSHLIYAGADFILVPSIFEPCGLTQLIAMRYGSIPVVRKTGGLYDTVFDVDHDKERADAQGVEPNGFSFDGADAAGVDYALNRAISAWYDGRDWFNSLCKTVMEQDWSWNKPALDYMELYHAARK